MQSSNIHIISHSHGGNVIEQTFANIWTGYGLVDFRRTLSTLRKVKSITSVGTPFIPRQIPLHHRAMNILGGFLTSLIALPLMLALVVAFFLNYANISNQIGWTAFVILGLVFAGIAFTIVQLALAFPLYIVAKYTNFFEVPIRPGRQSDRWLSVWHPNDEAIFALQAVDKERVRYVTHQAVAKAFLYYWYDSAIFSIFLIAGGIGVTTFIPDVASFFPFVLIPLAVVLAAAFVLPVLYIFFTHRLLAKFVNWRATRVVRSIIYGQDQPVLLGRASTGPNYISGMEFCIEGGLADKMANRALERLLNYIREHKRSLMLVNAPMSSVGLMASALDGLKGDELIHTTYFEYDEIVDLIADHIARHTV
jgi:MFS family permease